MIEKSVADRTKRGVELFRERGDEIESKPSGGYSVPSRTSEGRSYRVSLADGGRCGCPDHRRTRRACLHVYAATIHEAKSK